MLGDFADDRVLPHRLGDLTETRFDLIKLNDSLWFAADHAMQITDVQIEDESIESWEQVTDADADGNVWTLVLLGAPAPPGVIPTASGVGKRNPSTGALIENPAEVMEYISGLAGRSDSFPMLRGECAENGYVARGSLDTLKSIRSWYDEIAYSFAAIWAPGAGRLYPTTTIKGARLPLDQSNSFGVVPIASLEDTCDVLRVSYNVDGSTGKAKRYVQLSARPHRYGGVPKEVVLKWTGKPTNAESIGRRMLQRMGGRTYSVTLTLKDTAARPGDWRRFEDHREWPTEDVNPYAMLLAIDCDPDKGTNGATLEVIADPPTVDVTSYSIAVPAEAGAAVDVQIVGNQATFGITDEKGRPMMDALASLDGGAAKKTNAQGKVTFFVTPATPPRKHQLAVDAPGYTTFILDVFL